jgi:hypothetical protein
MNLRRAHPGQAVQSSLGGGVVGGNERSQAQDSASFHREAVLASNAPKLLLAIVAGSKQQAHHSWLLQAAVSSSSAGVPWLPAAHRCIHVTANWPRLSGGHCPEYQMSIHLVEAKLVQARCWSICLWR